MVSLAASLRAPGHPVGVCQTHCLSPGLKFLDKQISSFTKRVGVYFSLLSVQCLGNGSLPRTVSIIVTVLWDPRMQAPLTR